MRRRRPSDHRASAKFCDHEIPCHDLWVIVVPFNENPGCAADMPDCYRSRRVVGETGLIAGKQPR